MNLEFIIDKTVNGIGDSDRHLSTLFSLVIGSKGKNILELGVRNGDTTLPFLLGEKINQGKVYSVDINDTTFDVPNDLKQYWDFSKMDSVDYLEKWDTSNSLDIVYIDDWHSYDHVKKELEILDRLVSPSSIILLHDLMYGGTSPFYHSDITLKYGQWANGGPYRAVAELDQQFWEFSTLPWNNGLTILRKKYSNKYKQR
jgi:predicted O-methyltransferase YrrM